MKINNQLKLAAAVAAGMVLVGCGSDDDTTPSSDSFYSETVTSSSCFNADTCSASGFEFPEDAVFVAPNASNGDDITSDLTSKIDDYIGTPNTVLVLPKGTFKINNTIGIQNSNNLTIVGHGIRSTTLDFSDSTGEDGLNILGGQGLVIRDLSVNEAGKNAIAAGAVTGIHFNYVGTVWDVELTTDTESAYGIYPVNCSEVVVENSYTKGSNDAGIYVGQSNNIVVRNNVAEYNIAGIEIENSNNADVYNNTALRNSAGLLSFDLPNLDQAAGTNTRWFNNESYNNNTTNVGPGTVGKVPSGTGILILATDDVEIYNNNIYDNKSAAVAITSFFIMDDGTELDQDGNPTGFNRYEDTEAAGNYITTMLNGWAPFTKNVQVHDNTLTNNSYKPDTSSLLSDAIAGYLLGLGDSGVSQNFPTVLYDGVGELQALSGAFALLGHPAYTAGQKHCVYDNTINNPEGLTAYIGSLYDASGVSGASAVLLSSTMGEDATLLNCGETPNTRLNASTATIRGVVYGCGAGGDDESSEPACTL